MSCLPGERRIYEAAPCYVWSDSLQLLVPVSVIQAGWDSSLRVVSVLNWTRSQCNDIQWSISPSYWVVLDALWCLHFGPCQQVPSVWGQLGGQQWLGAVHSGVFGGIWKNLHVNRSYPLVAAGLWPENISSLIVFTGADTASECPSKEPKTTLMIKKNESTFKSFILT